jgi:translocation and assembly module TamA
MPASAAILETDSNYRAEIIAADGSLPALVSQLDDLQKTLTDRQTATSSEAGYVLHRFEQDHAYLQKTLEAEGYYEAVIQADYDEAETTAHFSINPGVQYHFGDVRLTVTDKEIGRKTALNIPPSDLLQAKTGAPAIASSVLDDEAKIYSWMDEHNCLFEHEVHHEAVIDNLTHRVSITYQLVAGADATVGDIAFKGTTSIATNYLQRLLPIKKGDCFRRGKLNDARLALQKTGLLVKAYPMLPTAPEANGEVPIMFDVTERAKRSIKVGASYSTDVGPGVSAGWEHRNLFGEGEKLATTLSIATLKQTLDAQFEKPFFLRDDQTLKLGSTLEQQDSDAFKSTGLNLSAGIEHELGNHWLAGAGVKYGFNRIKDQDSTEDVALLSSPLFASQDKRDDVLNPQSGWTFRVDIAPFLDTIDYKTTFLKSKIGGTFYQPLRIANKPLLALRAQTGSILGIATDAVPATERFFAGGGGSIRGYGYQLAGPLDAQNDPLGGRSFIETSVELRMQLTEEYGLVTFIDGGNAYDSALPDFAGGMRFGAGLGFRYYTSFGPLRADIAIPLDKLPGVDDPYQLYFSIGQAF